MVNGEETTSAPNLMEMPSWFDRNPCPSIVTEEPGEPVGWDRDTVGVTVKSVSRGALVAPEARITKRPPGAGGIVTSAVHTPCELAETPTSVKPLPTVTDAFPWPVARTADLYSSPGRPARTLQTQSGPQSDCNGRYAADRGQ